MDASGGARLQAGSGLNVQRTPPLCASAAALLSTFSCMSPCRRRPSLGATPTSNAADATKQPAAM